MSWKIQVTSPFKRGYSRLSSLDQKRVGDAVRFLASSKDPRRLGVKKQGKLGEFYSYEIGQGLRMLYFVSFENQVIILIRVGGHEEVYRG